MVVCFRLRYERCSAVDYKQLASELDTTRPCSSKPSNNSQLKYIDYTDIMMCEFMLVGTCVTWQIIVQAMSLCTFICLMHRER